MIMGKKYYTVYTLAYPDNTVFYVGKTQTGVHRKYQHMRDARLDIGCNAIKRQIIRGIVASGKRVVKRTVYRSLVESEALAYEKYLIMTTPNLCNVTHNRKLIAVEPVIIKKRRDMPYEQWIALPDQQDRIKRLLENTPYKL